MKNTTYKLNGEKYGTWMLLHRHEDGRLTLQERMEFGRAGRTKIVLPEQATQVCGVLVPDGGRSVGVHDCGKPIKDEALEMCGVHARSVRRAEEQEAERTNRRARNRAQIDEVAAELEALGVKALPEVRSGSDFIGRWTGNVVINLDELKRVLAQSA